MSLKRKDARVVDPVLSTVAHGYSNEELVGEHLFPTINVPSSGAKVIKFDKTSFQLYNAKRSPGAKKQRLMFGFAAESIALEQDSLEGQVPEEHMRDSSMVPSVDLGTEAVEDVMGSLALGLEHEQATLAQDETNYDNNHKVTLSPTDSFVNPDTNTKSIILDAKEAVRSSTGRYPNVAIVPASVYEKLDVNNDIRDRVKYTSSDSADMNFLQRYWGVDKVVVAKSIFSETEDEDSELQDVWSSVILAYVPASGRRIRVPSYGYTYQYEGNPIASTPYWDNTTDSWIYPVKHERKAYQTGMGAGFLISNPAAE